MTLPKTWGRSIGRRPGQLQKSESQWRGTVGRVRSVDLAKVGWATLLSPVKKFHVWGKGGVVNTLAEPGLSWTGNLGDFQWVMKNSPVARCPSQPRREVHAPTLPYKNELGPTEPLAGSHRRAWVEADTLGPSCPQGPPAPDSHSPWHPVGYPHEGPHHTPQGASCFCDHPAAFPRLLSSPLSQHLPPSLVSNRASERARKNQARKFREFCLHPGVLLLSRGASFVICGQPVD